ncbi:MAG: hypothetical protein L3J73_05755, partial [Thermoplasmata archaeon]|nr:hypothetical protein [Thermoplasmata archaeon]
MAREPALPPLLLVLAVTGIALLFSPITGLGPARGITAHSEGAVPGLETDAVPLPRGVPIVGVAGDRPVLLTLALTPAHAASLRSFDAALGDPTSPLYRHFLTEGQFEQQFEPTDPQVTALEAYFSTYGARSFQLTPDHLGLQLKIPVRGAEAALGVRYVEYPSAAGLPLFTAVGTAKLPEGLAGSLVGLGGLTDLASQGVDQNLRSVAHGSVSRLAHTDQFVTDPSTGGSIFTGSDYVQAYHEPSLFPPSSAVPNATFAQGEAVATILMSGYNGT